jgi:hypothetical protein
MRFQALFDDISRTLMHLGATLAQLGEAWCFLPGGNSILRIHSKIWGQCPAKVIHNAA